MSGLVRIIGFDPGSSRFSAQGPTCFWACSGKKSRDNKRRDNKRRDNKQWVAM